MLIDFFFFFLKKKKDSFVLCAPSKMCFKIASENNSPDGELGKIKVLSWAANLFSHFCLAIKASLNKGRHSMSHWWNAEEAMSWCTVLSVPGTAYCWTDNSVYSTPFLLYYCTKLLQYLQYLSKPLRETHCILILILIAKYTNICQSWRWLRYESHYVLCKGFF